MNRSIRAAAVQLRAHDRGDFLRSLDLALEAASEAASRAQLVVLPEATLPAYVLGDDRVDDAAIAEGLRRLCEIARAAGSVIVVGAAVRDGDRLRNGAVVIDADGSLAGRADKIFLWHFDRRWFAGGEHLAPVETALGKLGVLVCADGRLPTIASALVDGGAQALVMPTAWVTTGRDPLALENFQADLLARVRAYENGVPFVAANKCGAELGMVAYCGKSQILDRRGEIVAMASEQQPETLVASIELGSGRPRGARASELSPRDRSGDRPLRLAISYEPLPADVDARLELLDDAYAIAPGDSERLAMLDRAIPVACAGDELVLDPTALVGCRRAEYPLVIWTTNLATPWSERIARARAAELRIFIVVFDAARRRAFAVDPEGAIVAGTFGDYRLASFALDPRKTKETAVAPSTDVSEGLQRVAAILERQKG